MKIISNYCDITIDEKELPLFFHSNFLKTETDHRSKILIVTDTDYNYIIPIQFTQLRFLTTAKLLCAPFLLASSNKNTSETNFLEKVVSFCKKEKCDVILPSLHFDSFNTYPSNSLYYKIGIIKINLKPTKDEIFSNMQSEYRRQIRKGEKLNLTIKFDNGLIDDFYFVYKQTFHNQNIPCHSINYFKKNIKKLENNAIIGVAYLNNKVQSSILLYYDNKNAYSIYSGTCFPNEFRDSNKYLTWKSFLYLKDKGIENFIYGGHRPNLEKTNKLTNIVEFKLRFGAEIEYGYHFIKLLKPWKYRFFLFLLKIKSILTRTEQRLINLDGLEVKKST